MEIGNDKDFEKAVQNDTDGSEDISFGIEERKDDSIDADISFDFGLREVETQSPDETADTAETVGTDSGGENGGEDLSDSASTNKAEESEPAKEEAPPAPIEPIEGENRGAPVIKIENLSKVFVIGKEKVRALYNVNLTVYRDEIICLLGTSGSGKSTLLNLMAGLEKPTRGSITIYGERVDKMSEKKLAVFRQKNMGFVFQSYNLLPNQNAIDNVSMPLAFAGVKRRERNKRSKEMLKLCGLGKRMKHKPTQMSGGQQQRVGIARAFVAKPKIVFADEPTGNLDTRTTIEIMEMMVSMSRKNHQTLVIVTHDVEIAAYADKIYHIIDGVISSVEDNRSKQIAVGSQEAAEIIKAAEAV